MDNTAYQNYFTTKGKIVKSIHPPDTNLAVKIGEEEVIATPFRKDDNVKSIIEQNNFTNLSLKTIGNQLVRIEQNMNTYMYSNKNLPETSSSRKEIEIDKVLFKPLPSEKLKLNLTKTPEDSEVLEEIMKRLKSLGIKDKGLTPLTQNENSEQESESEDHIDHLEIFLKLN